MEPVQHSEEQESPARTWIIIFAIALVFALWGTLIYKVIGEKGPPGWDFSIIPDIPGESLYSTGTPVRPHGLAPGPYQFVDPQHVMGPPERLQKEALPK